MRFLSFLSAGFLPFGTVAKTDRALFANSFGDSLGNQGPECLLIRSECCQVNRTSPHVAVSGDDSCSNQWLSANIPLQASNRPHYTIVHFQSQLGRSPTKWRNRKEMPASDNDFLHLNLPPLTSSLSEERRLEAWESPKLAFDQGHAAASQGDWINAAHWYLRVVHLARHVEAGHFNLANVLFELQLYEDSVREYREALALVDDPATWNNLGNCLGAMFRLEEAIQAYRTALDHKSPEAGLASQLLFNCGRAYLSLDQFELAAESFRSAWEKHPGNPRLVERYLRTLAILGDWKDGIRFGELALQMASCKVEACEGLAILYEEQGRWDLALSYLVQAAEWFPEDPRPFARLARHHSKRGRISEAAACIHRSASLAVAPPAEIYSHWIQMLQSASAHSSHKVRDEAKQWRMSSTLTPCRVARQVYRQRNSDEPAEQAESISDKRTIAILANDDVLDAVAFQLLPYLQARDHALSRIHLYWCSLDRSGFQERIRGLVDRWIPSHQATDSSIAWMIRSEKADLLVDMIGHGPATRIGVAKHLPETVAVLWNYAQQTSGQPEYAFRIALGEGKESHRTEATETPIDCLFPSLASFPSQNSSTRDVLEAEDGATIRLGYVGPMKRMTHESLDNWSSFLNAFPNTTFEFFSEDLQRTGTREEVLDGLVRRGVNGARIRFGDLGNEPSVQAICDWISRLDVFVCSAPIASMPEPLFALSVGTPVLGYRGDSTTRSSIASLKDLLPHSVFIANDAEEAIEELATNIGDIKNLRSNRQDRKEEFSRSSLADRIAYAQSVDRAWHSMVDQVYRR
jgi:tetratricopeptide (TPR) repeat protein